MRWLLGFWGYVAIGAVVAVIFAASDALGEHLGFQPPSRSADVFFAAILGAYAYRCLSSAMTQ